MSVRFLNCLFFGLVLLMNYLANALPLNGKTTGQLSDQYPNLFVPAGITFSIWGIIYLLLLIYCIVQFFRKYANEVQSISNLVTINFSLNAAWIVCWHYEYVAASLLIMVGLLLTLVWINKALINSRTHFLKLSFGVYIGWICIAIIANVTALLVHYNWSGFGIVDEIWAMLMIVSGAALTVYVIQHLQNPYIAIAVIWGFAGIILKRYDDHVSIVIASSISIIVVTASVVYFLFNKKKIESSKN